MKSNFNCKIKDHPTHKFHNSQNFKMKESTLPSNIVIVLNKPDSDDDKKAMVLEMDRP